MDSQFRSKPPSNLFAASLGVAVCVIWILFLYSETAKAMVQIWWRSETFTHAFLVPPISMWLIWRQRDVLASTPIRPNYGMLPVLGLIGFAWLMGNLVAVNAVTQLAIVCLIVVSVAAVCGLAWTRQIAFPLAFLFFAVPIGEFAMPTLMEWTADFTVLALRFSGIPVFREGLQFVIPSGSWSVVEACSGVRYLIASVTVGTLFAYLNYQSVQRRAVFILISILVPVLANWIRAYLIVMLGHISGNKLAAGVDHLIYGWVFFGIVIMAMFYIGSRWAEVPHVAPNIVGAPKSTSQTISAVNTPLRMKIALFWICCVLTLPLVFTWKIEQTNKSEQVLLTAPLLAANTWSKAPLPFTSWVPAFTNPSTQITLNYTQGDTQLGLYIGYYRQQGYERKLVSSNNALVRSKDSKWAQVAQGSGELTFGGDTLVVRAAELRGSALESTAATERLAVRQLYWINGRLTASDVAAKIYGALARLTGQGDDSAVIILYTPVRGGGMEDASLNEFAKSNGNAILSSLKSASEQ